MVQRWSFNLTKALRTIKFRWVNFLFIGVAIMVFSFSPLLARPAAAEGISIGSFNLGNIASSIFGSNSCSIPGVGWVVCPTMRTIARFADYGFAYLNQDTLKIRYSIFNTGGDNKTFQTWEIMRNIAGGLLVVIFLYIIYGYLVGRTGGAYSLKRLIPKLAVTAILIYASWYAAVILVDVSNITGDSLWAIMRGIYGDGAPLPLGDSPQTLGKIAGNVMGGTSWPTTLPLLATVTVSISLISSAAVLLFVLRDALIATLILASPILVVLYLLPNTERISVQSIRMFFRLLILYPIVAVLLGVGQIIGTGVSSWENSAASYAPLLVGSLAAAAPLLAAWYIFKNTSSLMDIAGARLSASVDSRRGNAFDKDARVTGKASAGVASMKNTLGAASGLSPRKVSFGRNRRRASIADSLLTANGIKSRSLNPDGLQQNTSNEYNSSSTLSNAYNSSELGQTNIASNSDTNNEATSNEVNSLNQNITATNNDIQQGGTGDKILTAVLGAKGREKDNEKEKKSTSAKDIFSSLNRGMGHESKDKQRSFGAGPGLVGGTQASSQAPSGQQTAGPATSYRAPSMAQDENIISGGSVSSGQTPVQTIAVPVAVDASALLNRNTSAPSLGNPMSPIVGTQKDAEARANKYIFDSQRDINDARDAEDILGHKRNTLDEPPHSENDQEKSLDQDENK